MKRLIPLLLITITVLSGCVVTDFFNSVKEKFSGGKLPTQEIVLETKNEKIQLTAEIADSTEEREKGLMDRKELADGNGMLFVFPDSAERKFWMKNTLIPLDLLFFDENKSVVSSVESMQPCDTPACQTYDSYIPAEYALELPTGFIAKHKVKLGDKLFY